MNKQISACGVYLQIFWKSAWMPLIAATFAVAILTGLDSDGWRNPANWWAFADEIHATANVDTAHADNGNNVQATPATKRPIVAHHIHAALAATTALLIFLNTAVYLYEARSEGKKSAARKRLTIAFISTLFCEVITLLWLGKLVLVPANKFPKLIDEYIPLAIFSVFILVDFLTWSAHCAERKLLEVEKIPITLKENAINIEFAKYQLLLVDLPVVTGIISALVLGAEFEARFSNIATYLEAFFTGAVVMHLAASQIIFFILSIQRGIQLRSCLENT